MRTFAEDWIHPICTACLKGDKPKYHVTLKPNLEACCWCGQMTQDGFYQRRSKRKLPRCPGHAAPGSIRQRYPAEKQ